MTLAAHVATLGRGPGRSRDLTRDEAKDAMRLMLSGDAAPEAIGALLMLLRMKGETADEIAGLSEAARAACPPFPAFDLDWPSYAAGRSRGLPWFLLAARLVAQAGHRVLLHGWNGHSAAVRDGLADAGIPVLETTDDLKDAPIAYLPLEAWHPRLFALLNLRDTLGLRSCINTVCRMLNPANATASVQGVFHPSYRLLQADAARLQGWQNLTVVKGGGGEFECHPAKALAGFGLRNGDAFEATYPARLPGNTRLAEGPAPKTSLKGLWSGVDQDPFAEAIVLGTAARALETLGHKDPEAQAQTLWTTRHETNPKEQAA